MDLSFFRQLDQVTPKDGEASKTIDTIFRETVTLSTTGHIIHPNLVELRLAVTGGLGQETFTSPNESGKGSIRVLGYDVRATLLRRQFAPLTVYARRNQDVVSRQFGSSFENTNTTEGLHWEIRSRKVPTWFELYRQTQELSGGGGQPGVNSTSAFTQQQDVFQWHSETKPTRNQQLTWDFSAYDVQETADTTGGANNSFKSDEGTLAHTWDFGPRQAHNLTSTVNAFQETGRTDRERFRWDEGLRFRHTPHLRTDFHYSLNQDKQDQALQTQQQALAGVQHQLFESLVTTANLGAIALDQDQAGQTRERFGDIGWAYRKRVPYGTLLLNLDLAINVQETTGGGAATAVAAESHTFTDPNPVVLNRRNVNPASLVVTDSTGLITFAEGPDFTVAQFPNRTELNRVITGRIADGDTVKASFTTVPIGGNAGGVAQANAARSRFILDPSSGGGDPTTTTTSRGYGGRYVIERGPLRGLSVYAREFRQKQTSTAENAAAGETGFIPDNLVDDIFGAEYRFWKVILNAERELRDSTISPSNTTRLSGLLVHRGRSGISVGLNGTHTIIDFTDDNTRTVLSTLAGRLEKQLTRRLFGSLAINWRTDDNRDGTTTEGIEEVLDVRWKYRQTQIFALIRNSQLNTDTQDNLSQTVEVGIRRDF